jgi:DNA-binding NarL/FixJ family response regulator
MTVQQAKPILLVHANHAKVSVVECAAEVMGIADRVFYASDGIEPIAHLRDRTGETVSVIILVMGDPPSTELAILERLKADVRLKTIPVVILAPSDSAALVDRSFALGAVGYIVESFDAGAIIRAVQAIDNYWSQCSLPQRI